jgi:butyryl-CoA dehydrogenase
MGRRELGFQLWEVHRAGELCGRGDFAEHDPDSLNLMLEAAGRLAREVLLPLRRPMDLEPPVLEGGRVRVHPGTAGALAALGQGGWVGANLPAEHGGLGLPLVAGVACRALFAAANYSLSVYPMLAAGVARLLISFAEPGLREAYLPRLLDLSWTGTMALTEPQAGSSLADIQTEARPAGGHYLLSGRKLFISGGDQDASENIVHLLLARVAGAPAGVKGISLFLAPKLRPGPSGLEPNDIACSGLFHKLGYRGMPLTQLSLGEEGECRAWLVGPENQGLACMFQMMNEARLEVGLAAAGVAAAAFRASLDYARTRLQGRPPGEKDPQAPPVELIRHADVRRLLLKQRAIAEGGLGLVLEAARQADLARLAGGADQRRRHETLLGWLTPLAKSFPAEKGVEAVSAGLQVLGGYGYCREYPLELFLREARIHPIHEGATAIQAQDLLGRKALGHRGEALALFTAEVRAAVSRAAGTPLEPQARRLDQALAGLVNATSHLEEVGARRGAEAMLADAALYLEAAGLVAAGWQWLRQGLAAFAGLRRRPGQELSAFYRGKIMTGRYFFAYELPQAKGLVARLNQDDPLTTEMEPELFG